MQSMFKALSLACLLAVPLSACGEAPAPSQEDAAGSADSEMVVTDRNAGGVRSQAGANLDLPDGFPDDIPVHDSLNIYGANAIPGMGFSVTAISPESASNIARFYRDEMGGLGWTEVSGSDQPATTQVLRFEKEGRIATINLMPNNGGTAVAIAALNQN